MIDRMVDALVGVWHWAGDRRASWKAERRRRRLECPCLEQEPTKNEAGQWTIPALPDCPIHGLPWP